jgi:D-inositol-3-phosphate glycosyltransferase
VRIAVLSLHTSPAALPGRGDAGGLNVYVRATAGRLAALGHTVDIFTADPAAAGRAPADTVPMPQGVAIHQLETAAVDKDDLAGRIPELARRLAAHPDFVAAEAVWAHYWISALAGLAALDLAGTGVRAAGHAAAGRTACGTTGTTRPPLAVTFHTIAAVKDRDSGHAGEPAARRTAEARIAERADVLVANTSAEANDIAQLLHPAAQTVVAPPGIDHAAFTPGTRAAARRAVGLQAADLVVLYVGRMQYIKGTDVAIDALGRLRETNPELAARTTLAMVGAGSGGPTVEAFAELAAAMGVEQNLYLHPPVPAERLAQWYRAADVVIVPSRSESFGFVAAEAAACAVPVLGAAVGGLARVVADGSTGVLVRGHEPEDWAGALEALLLDPELRTRLGRAAADRAGLFDWNCCVDMVLDALAEAAETAGAVTEVGPVVRLEAMASDEARNERSLR